MMHKAWSSMEEVPYCFSRSSIKFQVHIALKIVEFDPNWAFPDCNSSWIHRWLWNVAQSLKQQRRYALLFSKVIHQISRSHGTNITDFDPNWAFPDYTRLVAAFKSLRFALLLYILEWDHRFQVTPICCLCGVTCKLKASSGLTKVSIFRHSISSVDRTITICVNAYHKRTVPTVLTNMWH